MAVIENWQVRNLPVYTREQIRVLSEYEDMSYAGIIACAVDDYYLKAVLSNPALAKFRELSRE